MRETIINGGQNLSTILIDYTEKDGSNEGWREVEPYSIKMKNGIEYFYGYDVNKGGIRGFIFDSINAVQLTNNSYEPRWSVEF